MTVAIRPIWPEPYPTERDAEAELDVRQPPSAPAPRIRIVDVAELAAIAPPEPLIEGVLGKGGVSAIIAPYGGFKSFVALDMALCVAHGIDWHGYRVSPGLVVYQAGEGGHGLYRRVEAYRLGNQLPEHPARMRFIPQGVTLNDERDFRELREALSWLPDRPSLVTIDTLARSLRGNENSAEDTGRWLEAADVVREETGAHLQIVHHTGWEGTRSRGSSNIPASLDTEMTLERDGDRVTITCTKQKDGPPFAPITLEAFAIAPAESLCLKSMAQGTSRLSEKERQVLDVVPSSATVTVEQCKNLTGVSKRHTYRCLDRLICLGYVRRKDAGFQRTEAGENAP